MLQLFFALFAGLFYITMRHFWRNRNHCANIYDVLKGLEYTIKPNTGAREKRIITCPYCGSAPEITSENCSSCGRRL